MAKSLTNSAETYTFGPFQLSVRYRRLYRSGAVVPLGDRALDLLVALASRPGELISKKELLDIVWPGTHVDEGALRVGIANLRESLDDGRDGARYIVNVRGRGYSFVAPSLPAGGGQDQADPATTPVQGLRERSRRLIGRDEAVAEVSERLADRRLVTIVGPGGLGKTTLARAVAERVAATRCVPVCFVDLSVLTDPALIPNLIAAALGVQLQGDLVLGLLSYFRDQAMLLVLDSCEHVVAAVAELAEQIIRYGPRVSILGASREPLRITGEQVYRLPSLLGPPDGSGLTAEQALSFPAVQLLVERTMAARHDFQLTDAEADLAAEICRRLDGIALAIELAAASIGAVGLRETVSLLDHQFSLRWVGRRTAIPRHQTLRATLDWSYSLLTPSEQALLQRLSVFVGAFSLENACFVGGEDGRDEADVWDGLASLVAKSLVSTTFGENEARYRLLDVTRTYARAKLAESGEERAITRRHAVLLLNLLTGRVRGGEPDIDPDGLSLVSGQVRNLRVALPWCFSAIGDPELGVALTAAVAPALIELGLWAECEQWTALAITHARDGATPSLPMLELLVSRAQAMLLLDRQEIAVRAMLQQAERMAEAMGEPYYRLRALLGLHRYLTRNEDYAGSVVAAERMRDVADAARSAEMVIVATLAGGISHHFLGDQAAACERIAGGLAQKQKFGGGGSALLGHHTDFHAMVCLSRAQWLHGFPERAIATARRCVEFAERRKSAGTLGLSAIWTIQVYFWTQAWAAAEALSESLLELTERHPSAPMAKLGAALKGELLTRKGDLARGLPLLNGYLEVIAAAGRYSLMPSLAFVEGLMADGEWARASQVLATATDAAHEHHHLLYMPEMIRLRGELLVRQDSPAAEGCFREAMALANRQSALSWALRSACSLARLLHQQGRNAEALDAVRPVYLRFTEGFDTPDLVEARTTLRRIEAASTQ